MKKKIPQTIKEKDIKTQRFTSIDEQESLCKALSYYAESRDVLFTKDNNHQYSGILTEGTSSGNIFIKADILFSIDMQKSGDFLWQK